MRQGKNTESNFIILLKSNFSPAEGTVKYKSEGVHSMEIFQYFHLLLGILFFLCYAYQAVYAVIPFLKKKTIHKEVCLHNYAVLICARNEEAVLGQLLKSIQNQDYPKDKITTFVVADNCTDNTAEIAKQYGALCVRRYNSHQVGKGYALHYLLQEIHKNPVYKNAFDGYLVFDADNVLQENYITEMNKTFSDGYRIITGYRNSKNYGTNWISAGYGLWFLRETQYLNRSRMLLNASCAVSGTGFLFSREIIEQTGGWNCYLLTEDIEFTIQNILKGEKIGFCENAVLYDEQPTQFIPSFHQRMRWAKGNIQVYKKYGISLFQTMWKERSLSCFDMSMTSMPAVILTVAGVLVNLVHILCAVISESPVGNLLPVLTGLAITFLQTYLTFFLMGTLTTVTEWKQLHCSNLKKILYNFTFPLFMMTYIPISVCAVFAKVKWVPIKHNVSVSVAGIINRT